MRLSEIDIGLNSRLGKTTLQRQARYDYEITPTLAEEEHPAELLEISESLQGYWPVPSRPALTMHES
ncbi:hypothetical protein TMatcc_010538 [Talaromyces marneffei ATCC 18224]